MAIYDFEDLLDDIKSVLQNNLNTKITAINTEKSDSISMLSIDNNAYFLQGLNEEAASFDPFIVYGIEDIETIPGQGFSAENLIISVIICASETGISNINKLMFRYSRALRETLEENWQIANNGVKIVINRLMPISFKLLDSDEDFKAIGINIEATLA